MADVEHFDHITGRRFAPSPRPVELMGPPEVLTSPEPACETDPMPDTDTIEQLRTPEEWEQIKHVKVIDPDGWMAPDPKSWAQPISEREFEERCTRSTCDWSTFIQTLQEDT